MKTIPNDYKSIFESRGHQYNKARDICTTARNNEVDALLDLLEFDAEKLLIDAPAGGGIVAQRIQELSLPYRDIFCIEPAKQFAKGIDRRFKVRNDEIDNINMPSHCVHLLASLAGLHHVTDRRAIYQEWARVVKPKGIVAVADVRTDTPTAQFLNGFVNLHNSYGHDGNFIKPNEFQRCFEKLGFTVEENSLVNVPWSFNNITQLARYCISLFNLDKVDDPKLVSEAISDTVGIKKDGNGVHIQWQLQYAKARKY